MDRDEVGRRMYWMDSLTDVSAKLLYRDFEGGGRGCRAAAVRDLLHLVTLVW